jgi:hypothetical protein
MAKPKKEVPKKSNNELFNDRFNGRKFIKEYMDTIVESEVHTDGVEYANWLKKNVFKHKNTFSFLETVGVDNYVWLIIEQDTELNRKKRMIEKLVSHGFFLTCYDDVEGWLYVPTSKYIGNRKARNSSYSKLKTLHDGTIVQDKRKPRK